MMQFDLCDGTKEIKENCFHYDAEEDLDIFHDCIEFDEWISSFSPEPDSQYSENVHPIAVSNDMTYPYQKLTLAEELLTFFIIYNLSNKASQALLDILLKHGIDVPRSLYLLKQSSALSTIKSLIDINQTDFAYLTIKENILFCLQQGLLKTSGFFHELKIKINIDGLPLFKSSPVNLWPILMQIEGIHCPLPVAVFCGIGKPKLEKLVGQLCAELTELMTDGWLHDGVLFKVCKTLFICDAPARSFLQCIKGHSGYFGCGYCTQEGIYAYDRVTFPDNTCPLRTDEEYALVMENNQLSPSPFIGIVPLFSNFPPEYMHLVCLGVTRKLLHYYFTANKGRRQPCRLSQRQINEVGEAVDFIRDFFPCDFQRKPRTPSFFEHFKASELRTYLLYIAPIVLKKHLDDIYYKHFLLLHFAMYVFISSQFTHLYDCAARCIELFVHDMPALFGSESVIYNVHVLLHLHKFVLLHGPVDSFSAFPFENFLSLLKRRIKTNNSVFTQSVNQLIHIRSIYTTLPSPLNCLTFSHQGSKNNCAITTNGIIKVLTVSDEKLVSGFRYKFVKDLYSHPYPSSTFGIGFYTLSHDFVPPCKPLSKAICIPQNTQYLILPYA
jgi:hypothetical protein